MCHKSLNACFVLSVGCDGCDAEFQGDCPQCGPLIVVKDRPVQVGDPRAAQRSLPPKLTIDRSSIHGMGVFATRTLQKRLQFGPYKGVRIKAKELKDAKDTGYAFQVDLQFSSITLYSNSLISNTPPLMIVNRKFLQNAYYHVTFQHVSFSTISVLCFSTFSVQNFM